MPGLENPTTRYPWETHDDEPDPSTRTEIAWETFPMDFWSFPLGVSCDEVRTMIEDEHLDDRLAYWTGTRTLASIASIIDDEISVAADLMYHDIHSMQCEQGDN